jgi:hypothetical protein
MERYALNKSLRLSLLISIFALMGPSIAVRLMEDSLSSQWILFHHDTPQDQEDSGSSEDDGGDENNYVILETGLIPPLPTDLRPNSMIGIPSYREHHLEITAPPPKS